MNCPEQVSKAVLEIIGAACASIRAAGWSNNARYCAIEADHIHNLPDLLLRFDIDKLNYYLEVERVSYQAEVKEAGAGDRLPDYEPQWRILVLEGLRQAVHSKRQPE